MIYRSHTALVPPPNKKRQLYRVHQLTFDLDLEARRQSFTGTDRVTRGMSRAAQFEQGGTSHVAGGDDEEDGEEATSSAMDISGSTGMPPPHPPCFHAA